MNQNKHRAELAMIISLPETIKGISKPGRLRNLVDQLSKEAKKVYDSKYKQATPEELKKIGDGFDKFNERVKWSERPRHVLTYLSAIAIFIEDHNYTKINKLIVDVLDYYERSGNLHCSCLWPALETKKIWDRSFNLDI